MNNRNRNPKTMARMKSRILKLCNPGFNSPEFGGIGRISRLKPAEKWGILISVLPTGAGIVDFKTERMFVV